MVTLEVLLDKIAEELILSTSGVVTPDVVSKNQKTSRQGVIQWPVLKIKLALVTQRKRPQLVLVHILKSLTLVVKLFMMAADLGVHQVEQDVEKNLIGDREGD